MEQPTEDPFLLLTEIDGKPVRKRFDIADGESRIGRTQDAEICLPDTSVSRCHSRLKRAGNRVVLLDAGSHNGTYVDEFLIEKHTLRNGEVVRIGHCKMVFHGGVGTAHSETAATTTRRPTSSVEARGDDPRPPRRDDPRPPRRDDVRPPRRASKSRGRAHEETTVSRRTRRRLQSQRRQTPALIAAIAIGVMAVVGLVLYATGVFSSEVIDDISAPPAAQRQAP